MNKWLTVAGVVVMVAAIGACKSNSPTGPSPGGGNPGGGSTQTTTMTINANGVLTPNDITVAVGSRVTIVNNHNRSYEMNSDPHPEHSDCPAINDVGFLAVGQSKTTGNLNTARTCGIHEHNNPSNQNLIGTIRIQ